MCVCVSAPRSSCCRRAGGFSSSQFAPGSWWRKPRGRPPSSDSAEADSEKRPVALLAAGHFFLSLEAEGETESARSLPAIVPSRCTLQRRWRFFFVSGAFWLVGLPGPAVCHKPAGSKELVALTDQRTLFQFYNL